MALGSYIRWDIQTGGDDTNGGGFDNYTGTPGTDYSQQTSAQVTYTDLVINSVSSTKITSSANPFTSAHIGNIINITGGTDFTQQRVRITAVSSSIATCDKAVGTIGSIGGTGKLGGCLLSPGILGNEELSTIQIAFLKYGTYNLSTATSNVSGGPFVGPNYYGPHFQGYETTHEDDCPNGNYPTISANGYTVTDLFSVYLNGREGGARNIIFDGDNVATNACKGRAGYNSFSKCVFKNATTGLNTPSKATQCYATNCTIGINCYFTINCRAHDCGTGIQSGNAAINCLATKCTTYGIRLSYYSIARNCVVDNQVTGEGFYGTTYIIENCIASRVAGYGYRIVSNPGALLNNCAHYNCSSGRSNASSAFTDRDHNPITLTGNPFTTVDSADPMDDDYSIKAAYTEYLNAQGIDPYNQDSYLDVGLVQHADPASSGGGKSLIFG